MRTPPEKRRVLRQIKSGLRRTLSNPVHCFIFAFAVLCGSYTFLEILQSLKIIDCFYTCFLQDLESSQVGALLGSIVAADIAMLASTGLIGSMILRHSARTEEKGYTAIMFIGLTLVALLLSVSAIMIQVFAFTIALSMILLFTGVVELFAMLVYSLGLVSS